MSDYHHVPVLLVEVILGINPQPGQNFIDCTLGGSGYAKELAKFGKVLGIDADPLAIENSSGIETALGNFRNLQHIYSQSSLAGKKISGIVYDLGLSSAQLADESRGFSFLNGDSLDMFFGPENGEHNADYVVNHYGQEELANIIFQYGEERNSRRIAQAIVNARPLQSAKDLAKIIEQAIGRHGRIHPATKTFQALRIYVNQEYQALEESLPQALEILDTGGRLAIVTFHSSEDRIVKNFGKHQVLLGKLKLINKKVIKPSYEATRINPRARSAKLRVMEKI